LAAAVGSLLNKIKLSVGEWVENKTTPANAQFSVCCQLQLPTAC